MERTVREISAGSTIALFPSVPGIDGDEAFRRLREEAAWEQNYVFGSTPVPRLTAWYGDPGAVYTYSKHRNEPTPWTPLLASLRDAVTAAVGEVVPGWKPNSVLLNRYRWREDSVAWHADDEPELGEEPVIASLSFGATRAFHMKPREPQWERQKLPLAHGSLLVMYGRCQADWLHSIPKAKELVDERINLTFRRIVG